MEGPVGPTIPVAPWLKEREAMRNARGTPVDARPGIARARNAVVAPVAPARSGRRPGKDSATRIPPVTGHSEALMRSFGPVLPIGRVRGLASVVRRQEVTVGIDQLVDHGRDLVQRELGTGVRIEHRGMIDVLALAG